MSGCVGTARHAHDRNAGARLPIPAEIIEDSHRAGRIAGHRVDAAVRGARSGCENRPRFRRKTVDPAAEGDRLIGSRRVAEARPVAFFLDIFVGDRSFDHEHERIEFAALGFEKRFEKFRAAEAILDQRPVKFDARQAGQRAERDLFDARLHRRSQRDGVTVAAEARRNPKNVYDRVRHCNLSSRRSRQISVVATVAVRGPIPRG